MEKQKHTPGPWEASGNTEVIGIQNQVTLQRIAYVKPANQANACLIAAAPELLEALKEAEFNVGKHAEKSLNGDVKIWLKKTRATIAKAEGEENA